MNHPSDQDGEPENLKALEERQAHELEAFEARQREELQAFEASEREEIEELERREGRPFTIKIDRTEFLVTERKLTGEQLRLLPKPPIGSDRDLFEVVPGGSDRKIENNEEVRMRDGLRFFTAPAQINPGGA